MISHQIISRHATRVLFVALRITPTDDKGKEQPGGENPKRLRWYWPRHLGHWALTEGQGH